MASKKINAAQDVMANLANVPLSVDVRKANVGDEVRDSSAWHCALSTA